MNQTQPYMDVHQSHLSSAQPYAPQPATAGGMAHYPYPQQPVMQPGPPYPPSSGYGQYGYPNGVTSPQSATQSSATSLGNQMPTQLLPNITLPAMSTAPAPHNFAGGPAGPGPGYQPQTFDTTGQIAPPGMKPRVTATLWEDEGSLCFQVEAKGVCVARREDNHMINGTKLLNVAGMTRGRRDGILKSEKVRHVVKIGPMHLKGVWIPFERALDFANKEKITEILYPLFVHNIGSLLYHPSNQNRTNAVVAATERRRIEGSQQGQQPRTTPGTQPPSLTHHHSMNNPVGAHVGQPPHSIAPHPGAGRPGIDRAHTFPTPPTSASSTIGLGSQGSSYEWSGGSMPVTQPLSIDTGLSNARSMPTTPATTPPGNSMSNMQQYSGHQTYDKPYYSAPPPTQSQYASHPNIAQQNMSRFGPPLQPNQYVKNEMGPPSTRGPGTVHESDHHDPKAEAYSHAQGNGHVGHGTADAEADHDHEPEYIHDNHAAYSANRGPYAYNPGPTVGSLTGEHPHLSPEMTGSPSQQNGSGRGTPRTTATQHWNQSFHDPARPTPSSSLYNVMSDSQASRSNGSIPDPYASAPSAGPYASINGAPTSNKRMREEDDQDQRPDSRGADGGFDLKRRRTIREESVGGPVGGGLASMKAAAIPRRR